MIDLEDLETTFGEIGPIGTRRPWAEECVFGHPYIAENARLYKDKRGRIRRVCRACDRERRRVKRKK